MGVRQMGEQVVQHGLEGVIAFETQIAEPDREGGALRYRGVDIEELVGKLRLRPRLGLAGRRLVRSRAPACRAIPHPRAFRRHPRRRAERAGDVGPVLGPRATARHRRHAGARRPRSRLGDGVVVRRPIGTRAGPGDGAAEAHRPCRDHHRAVHATLAGRPRSTSTSRRSMRTGSLQPNMA